MANSTNIQLKPLQAYVLAKKISLKKCQLTNTYELELNFEANSQTELVLFADQEGNGLSLTVDTENGKVILDRSKAGEQYATDFGTSRECTLDAGQAATSKHLCRQFNR